MTTRRHLRLTLKTSIQQNRCVGAPAHCVQDASHKRCACEYRVRYSAEGCNSLLISSMFACIVQSVDGAKDRQKRGVFCMPLFYWYQDFVDQHEDPEPQVEHGRIKDHFRLCLCGWRQRHAKKQVCCACAFCACIKILCHEDPQITAPASLGVPMSRGTPPDVPWDASGCPQPGTSNEPGSPLGGSLSGVVEFFRFSSTETRKCFMRP